MTAPLTSAEYCGLSGWYWYCEEHDAHGIADSEDEAVFVMDAHVEYHELQDGRRCAESGLQVVLYVPDDQDAVPEDQDAVTEDDEREHRNSNAGTRSPVA
jgi:hypothetical protein